MWSERSGRRAGRFVYSVLFMALCIHRSHVVACARVQQGGYSQSLLGHSADSKKMETKSGTLSSAGDTQAVHQA